MIWVLILTWYATDGSSLQSIEWRRPEYEKTFESCDEYGKWLTMTGARVTYRCEARDR
jgi:hypothetical protein